MPARRFSVEAVFRAVDRFTAPVTRMQNRVGKMTRTIGRNVDSLNRKMDKFGRRARTGAMVIAAGAAIATAAMVNVVRTGAEFEQSLISAAAKFPSEIRRGTDAYGVLEDAARKAGRTTEFTAGQSAQALNFFAMAGINAAQAVAALPGALDLATIAQVDLGRATDIATDTLGAFNLMTEDEIQIKKNLARVNDVLAKTTNTANTDLEQMFESIAKGGPVAVAAGQDLETFSAFIGKMAGAGVKASIAGTASKKFFTSIVKQRKLLKRMGVDVADVNGDFRDAVDILGDFDRVTKNMGQVNRAAAVEAIFGERSLAAVNKLLSEGAGAIGKYREELRGAVEDGYAQSLADVIRDSLKVELKELNSAIESVKLSTFVKMRDALSDVINRTSEWVRANEDLVSGKLGKWLNDAFLNIDSIIEKAKQIGKITIAVGALVVVMKTLVLVLTLINLLVGIASGAWIVIGIVAIVAAVGALIAKFVDFKKVGATLGPFFKVIWDGIVSGFNAAFDGIVAGFNGIVEGITNGVNALKSAGLAVGGRFKGIFGRDDADVDDAGGDRDPQVVSPGDRVARSIEERTSVTRGEVTIKDETGRAEVSLGDLPAGILLQPTGSF